MCGTSIPGWRLATLTMTLETIYVEMSFIEDILKWRSDFAASRPCLSAPPISKITDQVSIRRQTFTRG